MLTNQGFNLWANQYDQTVQLSEDNKTYPFAGYKEVLNIVFNVVMRQPQSSILDIGFGTGVLTSQLYKQGHLIDGLDFSSEMISLARKKMPDANLIEWDISKGLPESIKTKKYDSIISTYALHHLTDEEKVPFIQSLLLRLNDNGKIVIGDIAFQTRAAHNQCRDRSKEFWDEDEFYFVLEELKPRMADFCHSTFTQVSHCGGVMVLSKT